ncbi:fumarylacetoacetate hydrolase family protein [Marinomonas sp. TI.3.20]|uniref:fumarylacetoacetate hydrolase family protein n=1 Tax=Marinomonas sp. TI.3.20 TaxID=3121296 RepID=UPI00311E0407
MFHYRIKKSNEALSLHTDAALDVPLKEGLLPATNGAVIGVALNDKGLYQSLVASFNEKPHVAPPKTPVLHIKTDNTHLGYGQPIRIPTDKGPVYAGPALGIVIGKKACRVTEEEALEYVKGYTIVNEVSLAETSFYRPAVKAKCRDTFCPIGPWIIDKNAVDEPNKLVISTYIDDELVHETNTDQLIYSVEAVISYISGFITLEVGDLIIAGTPERTAALEIKSGNSVTINIEGIGCLTNPVTQA